MTLNFKCIWDDTVILVRRNDSSLSAPPSLAPTWLLSFLKHSAGNHCSSYSCQLCCLQQIYFTLAKIRESPEQHHGIALAGNCSLSLQNHLCLPLTDSFFGLNTKVQRHSSESCSDLILVPSKLRRPHWTLLLCAVLSMVLVCSYLLMYPRTR